MMSRPIGIVVLALLTGCASTDPYVPSREIAGAIPRAQAIEAVTQILGRSFSTFTSWSRGGKPLTDIQVDDAGFAFGWSVPSWWLFQVPIVYEDGRGSYRYADLRPKAYLYDGEHHFVDLTGEWDEWSKQPDIKNHCLVFASREDLETFLDAVLSLSSK